MAAVRVLLATALALALGCDPATTGPTRPMGDGGTGTDSGPPGGCRGVDSDGDGIDDGWESSDAEDTDGDGYTDAEEAGTDPCAPPDSDGDGTPDFADTDSDNDGLSDAREREIGTDPRDIDSDDDGITDLGEVDGTGTDPTDATDTIPPDDFFVVLPYNGSHEIRPLRFGTNITVADVFFLMDTTGSMYSELDNIQNGMESTIIPGVQALIENVWFGAGGFDDFPVGSHGGSADRPYYHLVDVGPFEQDLGTWGAGGPFGVGQLSAPANGTPDIIDAVRNYPRHSGGNGCESGTEGLYQTATGEGVTWTGGSVPAKTCTSVPDEPAPRRGYPCFRGNALPIIVYISDAPLHPPLPPEFDPDTLEGASCNYTDVPTANNWADTAVALNAIGARVIALSSDNIPSNAGYPATQNMCEIARATGSVRADGSPLCFEIGPSGTMITADVVNAIGELVGGTPQDVSTRTENVDGNPDDFDATRFIKSITPVEGYRDGIPGTGYDSFDDSTFYQVIPGTIVEFSIDFWNDVRPPAEVAQIFRARIIVVGNGVADLDSREVYIVVPPDGAVVLI